MLPLERTQRWHFFGVSQPRFRQGDWEAMVWVGLLGYRWQPQHMVFLGLTDVHFYQPSAQYQFRLLQRWRSTFFSEQQVLLRLTVEERWTNGRFSEIAVRPFSRYRWPIGPLYLNLLHEAITIYRPLASSHFWEFRQNRLWFYVSYPRKSAWFVELGYLNLSRSGRLPSHRVWLGLRWRVDWPNWRPLRESDTAGPADEAQTPLPESPVESPVP